MYGAKTELIELSENITLIHGRPWSMTLSVPHTRVLLGWFRDTLSPVFPYFQQSLREGPQLVRSLQLHHQCVSGRPRSVGPGRLRQSRSQLRLVPCASWPNGQQARHVAVSLAVYSVLSATFLARSLLRQQKPAANLPCHSQKCFDFLTLQDAGCGPEIDFHSFGVDQFVQR